MLVRFLTGSGGYFLLLGIGRFTSSAADLAQLLLLARGILAWRPRDHRGLSGMIAGLRVVDTRAAGYATKVDHAAPRAVIQES